MANNQEISNVLSKIWLMDENRCVNGVDYEIDMQGYLRSTRVKQDRANYNFFEWMSDEVFQRPTYKSFLALLDNYEMKTGIPETVTKEEENENRRFIDAIMETKVMRLAHDFLVQQQKAPNDEMQFKKFVYDIWFKTYRRTHGNRSRDSSGFEHVFVGEMKGDEDILGLHNWIQVYLQERKGLINYRGYYKWGTEDSDDPRLVAVNFSLGDAEKPIGSSFMGTSPELEMAFYTICYLVSPSAVVTANLEDGLVVDINVHKIGPNLGSAYPSKHRDR
ncbi:poly(U)-specific endoribonuclease-B-like [Tubulanus polymorphus]|uniref:poly(U)-specific endoribonuclease-B-like n=1 Tax=Tubulanus polymorphus TaxID=672921 RepID=UPI003DA47492